MEIIGYIAAVFMGVIMGMIGGGGSILTVPILVYPFAIDPVLATAYSLFIVGLTALFGGYSYFKKGHVDLSTGFIFAVPSFIGVYITRAFVVPALPDTIFTMGALVVTKALLIMFTFAGLMVVASFFMIRTPTEKMMEEAAPKSISRTKKILFTGIEGLLVGGLTGFVGAGGGFLIIPALVILIGMPMKVAVGTSLFIIAAKSLIGFLGDFQHQPYIDWRLLLTLSGIAVGGLYLGMALSTNIPEKVLKKSFGYFVLIMGAIILFDQARQALHG